MGRLGLGEGAGGEGYRLHLQQLGSTSLLALGNLELWARDFVHALDLGSSPYPCLNGAIVNRLVLQHKWKNNLGSG